VDAVVRDVAAIATSVKVASAETKAALSRESAQRVTEHDEVLRQVRAAAISALQQEVRDLRSSAASSSRVFEELRDHIEVEVSQRQAVVDSALARFREWLEAEVRDSNARYEAVVRAIQEEMKERDERVKACEAMRAERPDQSQQLAAFKSGFEKHSADLNTRLDEEVRVRTNLSSEMALLRSSVEKRCTDLGVRFAEESQHRVSLSEELEEVVKSQRSKLRSLVTQMSDAVKRTYDELRNSIDESLAQESGSRNTQVEAIEARLGVQQSALDSLRQSVSEFELQHRRQANGQEDNVDDLILRLRRDLQHEISQCGGPLESRLAAERAARENLEHNVSRRIAEVEETLGGLRSHFLMAGRSKDAFLGCRALRQSQERCDEGDSTTVSLLGSWRGAGVASPRPPSSVG
jgi:hypothetical protein